MGKQLPPIPSEHKVDINKVKVDQSRVRLYHLACLEGLDPPNLLIY